VLEWHVPESKEIRQTIRPEEPGVHCHRFPFENKSYGQPWLQARAAMYAYAVDLLRTNPEITFKAYIERVEALDWFAPEGEK
jgi:hypothetical protein